MRVILKKLYDSFKRYVKINLLTMTIINRYKKNYKGRLVCKSGNVSSAISVSN